MAYNSNINSGSPPMLWSDFDSALRKINENFTLLGAVVARTTPISISHIESGTAESNPVKVVTASPHSFTSGQRVTITQTGIAELDNNTYYVSVIDTDEFGLYTDQNLTTAVNGTSYSSYSSGGGFVQGLSEFGSLDFENIYSNISPNQTETYDLGSSTKRWKDLYLSGSSIYLGDAVISSTGTTLNLPAGTTIDGLRVDENYFKYIAVSGQSTIEADDGTDTLNFSSGSGVSITTNASTDTITVTNTGVTNLTASSGIDLSSSTGNVTVTNTGVTSIAAGFGMSVNSSTGSVTITNEGLAGLEEGVGILLSERDPITGKITVTNSQPNIPQNVFQVIAVPTQVPIAADSTADTLTIQVSGDGLSITTDSATDTLTFSNTGVTSLAVGNGLAIDAGTGSINLTLDATLSRNIIGDVVGSVFAEDSTTLVDATGAKIVGNIETAMLRTSEVSISLGAEAAAGSQTDRTYGIAIGQGAGYEEQGYQAVSIGGHGAAGDVYQLNQSVGAVSIGYGAGEINQGAMAVAIGYKAGWNTQAGSSIVLNATGYALNTSTSGFFVDPIRNQSGTGNILQYDTTTKEIIYSSSLDGDLVGSVFADDSTKLVDAVEGLIVGAVVAPSVSVNGTFNIGTTGAFNQLVNIQIPSGGSLSINQDTDPVYFNGSGEGNVVVIEDGDITANTVFATALNTQDSSALLVVPPVNFQTTISTDQGIQLSGEEAIIRSDTSVRIVPTNSVESLGAELTITGLDVMGEPNIIIETATDQGTIQIGGDNNNTALVTVRKSTGEVYVGGFWRFLADGGLYSGYLDTPPDSPTAGAFYVADGATWDPASKSGAVPYPVFYDGASYHALY